MAIHPSSLRCKSLTPIDFQKLSSEPFPHQGDAKDRQGHLRRRSSSETEDPREKTDFLKEFSKKDFIRVEHLTVESAGEFIGFSAFFFAFISSAP
jgi:hypothetical protein